VFLRAEGLETGGGAGASLGKPGASVRPFARALSPAGIEWVPDLGQDIGSAHWWRGAATCLGLCAAAWMLGPTPFAPLMAGGPAPLAGAEADEARALAIRPLGLGSNVRRAAMPGDLVRAIADAPERPRIELAATVAAGDTFREALARAGVGRADAEAAGALLAGAVPAGGVAPGTRVALVLGRRPSRYVPRPLETLAMRARFDLDVTLTRVGAGADRRLMLSRRAIAVDRTPVRLQGVVGTSLYRSVRAAGAPGHVVEQLLKALSDRVSLSRLGVGDRFDLVIASQRAATGEVRTGDLLYASVSGGAEPVRLVRFDGADGGADGGQAGWFDPDGQAEERGAMGLPVAGRITSGFGWRTHPLLGFLRLHKGLDIAAPRGAPVYATIDGAVQFAGWSGGYGNFIKIGHGGGVQTGYGHLSRIAVAPGQRVERGQVIGYVGSTGLSTGPHLHWEVWRGGTAVNPASISYDRVSRLSGDRLARLKARVAQLTAVRVRR